MIDSEHFDPEWRTALDYWAGEIGQLSDQNENEEDDDDEVCDD